MAPMMTNADIGNNDDPLETMVIHWSYTNTKSLAKEFSKILIFEYFGYLRIDFDVFFDADSESPRMT